jgi:hypothetical protein
VESDSTKGFPPKHPVCVTEIYCTSPCYRKVQEGSPWSYCDIRLNKVAVSRVVNGFRKTECERVKKNIERPSVFTAEEHEDVQMLLEQSPRNSFKEFASQIYTVCPTPAPYVLFQYRTSYSSTVYPTPAPYVLFQYRTSYSSTVCPTPVLYVPLLYCVSYSSIVCPNPVSHVLL